MNDFASRIEKAWSDSKIKMDWLGMESLLRDILSSNLSDSEKVSLCRETISAFTHRG